MRPCAVVDNAQSSRAQCPNPEPTFFATQTVDHTPGTPSEDARFSRVEHALSGANRGKLSDRQGHENSEHYRNAN